MSGRRGSALSRAVKFFEEADLREAKAAFSIVHDVMAERVSRVETAKKLQDRAASTPRKTRKKRGEQPAASPSPTPINEAAAQAGSAGDGELTMAVIDEATLTNWFTWHNPTPEDVSKMAAIRVAALAFAKVIVENTPACADQSAAIRKVREAVFTSNAAIVCGGV